jgi:hypothetical protein
VIRGRYLGRYLRELEEGAEEIAAAQRNTDAAIFRECAWVTLGAKVSAP